MNSKKKFKHFKYKYFSYPLYLAKRHIFNQIMTGKIGKIWHYLKIIWLNKFFSYPRLAIIETGTTCNLNCATCPTPRHLLGRPPRQMDLEQFKKIINNIKDSVHVVLLYNTNEPLLNANLAEMIKYADKNNLYTMISTNVMLLNEQKTDELLKSGLDEIIVCLDGMSAASYEPFRTGADFGTVKKNIERFCAEKKKRGWRKPYVELQFIVTKLNQDEIPAIKEFAKKCGVDRLRTKSLTIGEYAYPEPRRSELMEKFLPTKELAKVKYKKGERGIEHKNFLTKCSAVKNQISILDNGQLAMCCYDIKGEYIFGNVIEKPFREIWLSEEVKRKREIAARRGYPLCKKCDIF